MGVTVLAMQNVLVQVSREGAPFTAVMTTNITRFVVDPGTMLSGHDARQIAAARHRTGHAWPANAGSAAGCALGAACQAAFGMWSLLLSTGSALLALGLSLFAEPPARQC